MNANFHVVDLNNIFYFQIHYSFKIYYLDNFYLIDFSH